jgi:hypothetical protein
MRILVVGKAALGEVVVGDRLDQRGRPRHLVHVLTDEDMSGPHEVFTCALFHMAVRYLTALEFDAVFLDGPLGDQVAAWLRDNGGELTRKPRLLQFAGPQSLRAIGGFDVAFVAPVGTIIAEQIRETINRSAD